EDDIDVAEVWLASIFVNVGRRPEGDPADGKSHRRARQGVEHVRGRLEKSRELSPPIFPFSCRRSRHRMSRLPHESAKRGEQHPWRKYEVECPAPAELGVRPAAERVAERASDRNRHEKNRHDSAA